MDLSNGLLFLQSIGLVLVVLGTVSLLNVPTKKSRTETANKILRKRAFRNVDEVKKELNDYFITVIWHLMKANLCFYVAFIVFTVTVAELNPNLSIFQVMARIVPFALIPCLISMIAKIQVKNLQWECFNELNEEN